MTKTDYHAMSLSRVLTRQRCDSDDASASACPIIVMGTLGAGKSTLLNAFVGRELLPADTAVPFRIDHCAERRDFRSRAALGDETSVWENATLEGLSKCNQTGHCTFVEVQGELSFGPNPTPQVALYDTPGTNYAPDRRRAERTWKVLERLNSGVILYMLSTRHLGADDEEILLLRLRETLQRKRMKSLNSVIFVLSHADLFDQGKPEYCLPAAIARQKTLLARCGFRDPRIVPVMARAALHIRMRIAGQPMSDNQTDDLHAALGHVERHTTSLLDHTDCSEAVRMGIRQHAAGAAAAAPLNVMHKSLAATNIPTLEYCLAECICSEALNEPRIQVTKRPRHHGAPKSPRVQCVQTKKER